MSYHRRMPIPRIRATARLVRSPKSPPKLSEVGDGNGKGLNESHGRLVVKISQGMGFPNKPL
jgi:hypothetical protein